jgi:hypothetical protein
MFLVSAAKSGLRSKSSAALETGPSLDPMQAQKAADQAAAEAKRQLKLSQSIKVAEEEAKKAAEAKKQAEAAAAAAAAAAAGPSKPVSKKRYKLLSLFPLLPPAMRRDEWSLNQFAVEKRLHKGYASEVYKVCCLGNMLPAARLWEALCQLASLYLLPPSASRITQAAHTDGCSRGKLFQCLVLTGS